LKIWKEAELPTIIQEDQFKQEFAEYCKALSNPEKIYETYFKMPERELQNVKDVVSGNNTLLKWKLQELQLLGVSENNILSYINDIRDEMDTLAGQGLIFRLVFVSLDINITTKSSFFEKLRARIIPYIPLEGLKYGLNHVALQIGPYLIHWTNSSLVTITPLASASACAMIYPDEKFKIKGEAQIKKVCEAIADWNLKMKYNRLTSNCQNFVEYMFTQVGCTPTWIPGGLIDSFVSEISKCEIGVHQMKIRDLTGKEKKIQRLRRLYCLLQQFKGECNNKTVPRRKSTTSRKRVCGSIKMYRKSFSTSRVISSKRLWNLIGCQYIPCLTKKISLQSSVLN